MRLVSDDILIDRGVQTPVNDAVYPMLDEFQLWNPAAWTGGQPYEFYAKMRKTAPVMWSPMGREASGFWSVSRYDDIKQVELAPDVFSSQRGSINIAIGPREKWKPEKLVPAALNSLINMDAPHHMELRIQQKDFFIPAYVESIREKVGRKIDSLLDDLEANGPVVDFVKFFSTQLPLFTLCEMLGVEEEDRPKIVEWMHYLELASQFTTNPMRTFLSEPTFPFRFGPAVKDMFAYGERVMADRRNNPRPDLLSIIAHSKIDGELLSQEFLDGSWLLIVFAGNDTSRNSLSGTIRLMTEFPDQRAMVLDDPSLIPRMSQEALRMISPVKHMRRTAAEDTELNGQRIAKDEKVVLWYGAGNRDPEVFPDPDRFDMMRDNVDKHIAFGHGVHKCLGSRVAQMQLRLAFERIFDRFPNITWTGHEKIAPNALVHAISSLKVNLYGQGGERPTRVQVRMPAQAAD
ncbi:cytochrome P450 [Pyruvatibacter mobilis]|uniref:cytochrome P450 n=1 Tax=Pyruvatibacter mobilis TaxID=1712261 RepID=UPI003BAA88EE